MATEAMTLLNDTGFALTDADLKAPEGQPASGVTIEYDPANLAAALTVVAAVDGVLVPTKGLGRQVRLLLGTTWNGKVAAVKAGAVVTGTIGTAAPDSAAIPTLTPGALPSVNAGQQLCA